jgi:hypothetical protein
VRTRADDRLRAEAARFALRFACEDCAHFDDAKGACLHGYPPSPRRAELLRDEIVFCKEFELTAETT